MPFLPYFQRRTLSFPALCFPNTLPLFSVPMLFPFFSRDPSKQFERGPAHELKPPALLWLFTDTLSVFVQIHNPFPPLQTPISSHNSSNQHVFVCLFFPALLDEIKGLFLRMASPVFMHIFHIRVLQPKAPSQHLALLREATQEEKSV